MNTKQKPTLSFWQIWNMSFGFLGIQYGFGLQQNFLSYIFRNLGAEESGLPVLWLAGPITGLVIQPIIGAISDGTWNRFGRRKPFFVIGALVGSVAVLLMPKSPYLWMAVGLFWILDASMNTAMEPYRALIGDKLNAAQRTLGFSVQTFMIAGGQVAVGLMPSLLLFYGISKESQPHHLPNIVTYSFFIGVAAMLITVAWTAWTTPEYPPDNLEQFRQEQAAKGGVIGKIIHAFKEIWAAVLDMPKGLKQIWWVKFFTWYGMPLMWQYLALSIARHCYNAPTPESPNFAEGAAKGGVALTVMNVTTVVMAILIPSIVKRVGTRAVYAAFLAIGGVGFISMQFTNGLNGVLTCMVLVGIGWSAIITIPFIMTTSIVPASRTGVYMGLLNAFICLPQILEMVTVGRYYDTLLKGDPRNAIALAGICLILGAVACLFISKEVEPKIREEIDERDENLGGAAGEVKLA